MSPNTPAVDESAATTTEEKLERLHAATRDLMRAFSRTEAAETAASAATHILEFTLNTVRLYDPEAEQLVPAAVSPAVEELAGERYPYDRGETVQWDAFDGGELLVFPDITEIDDDVPRSGEGSMLVAPLGEHGVLTLGSQTTDDIDAADVELARLLAANVEAAMDRAERRRTLRERTERLERQNERLDRFASILSHDLRNPLNVAAGYVELAAETGETDRLPEAAEALDRMDSLIDSTLALARQGEAVESPEPTDVGLVARQAWGTVETADATLDVDALPTVPADPERLRTLFENLFRNSVEHAGTDVAVRVERIDGDDNADGNCDGDADGNRDGDRDGDAAADAVGFAVSDDGPGLPAEDADRVLDWGYSTDDDGTGFGLAVVGDVAAAHGWTVDVDETADGGARFAFRF
ncbi:sensor histidine kinase [Halobaculum sp. P14]|uniref:sensor histidine kinase n=1 Tax=Halobaculum sp. P14 TaxID=3421638 RepID=UPI003EBC0AA3